MDWLNRLLAGSDAPRVREKPRTRLRLATLEAREVPAVMVSLAGNTLNIVGDNAAQKLVVSLNVPTNQLVVTDNGRSLGRFPNGSVAAINVTTGTGNDRIQIARTVLQPATINAGTGNNLVTGGGGPTNIVTGNGRDKVFGTTGPLTANTGNGNGLIVGSTGGNNVNTGATGSTKVVKVTTTDTLAVKPTDKVQFKPLPVVNSPPVTIDAGEVATLLRRAAAASATNDGIFVVVDRNGRILGVRSEAGVDAGLMANADLRAFAVDGAVALARTGAFFANNAAPLTSRTIRDLSQSTIIQREVEAYPFIQDPNSTLRGPGLVAPIGIGSHFPRNIALTPQVDLAQIEHTNRDSIINNGADRIRGTIDDITLRGRFNIDNANPSVVAPGQRLFAPESYGFVAGISPNAQSRGIATLPGGIPIFKNGTLVGGIGVFFPGKTGFASESNSHLGSEYNNAKPDRAEEAEYVAFAAVGGSSGANLKIGTLGGVGALPGFDLPFGRIDLVGITLDLFGPGGNVRGPDQLRAINNTIGRGSPDSGANLTLGATSGQNPQNTRAGLLAPEGWLVLPQDGRTLRAADVQRIIREGIAQSQLTKAAIRTPVGARTKMVYAVADSDGTILGLFREPDATIFSIDVAVAKARNVAYYADANQLKAIDQLAGVPKGVAFTNRTIRYLSLPFFPEGIDGTPPAPFSQLNDGGSDPRTGRQVGPRLPASAFQSVVGFDSFNPGTNFRQNPSVNQNGIVFFPGSAPVYKSQTAGAIATLSGGFGVSGDGVDQDDVVTAAGAQAYATPLSVLKADQVYFTGIRLPYQKFLRNPEG